MSKLFYRIVSLTLTVTMIFAGLTGCSTESLYNSISDTASNSLNRPDFTQSVSDIDFSAQFGFSHFKGHTDGENNYLVLPNSKIEQLDSVSSRADIAQISEKGIVYTNGRRESVSGSIGADGSESWISKKEVHLYKYYFQDSEPIDLGFVESYCVSDKLDILYEKDGRLYTVGASSDSPKLIAQYNENIILSLYGVANNGNFAIYSVNDTSNDEPIKNYLYNDGAIIEIDSSLDDAVFTKSGKLLLLYNEKKIALYKEGQLKEIEFNGTRTNIKKILAITTKDGKNIKRGELDKLDDFYVTVRTKSDNCELYYIDSDGIANMVLNGLDFGLNYSYITIKNRTVYYVDQHTLFQASLDKKSISEKQILLENIESFMLSDDGQYIYALPYRKPENNKHDPIICYSLKNGEVKIIEDSNSDLFCMHLTSKNDTILYIIEEDDTNDHDLNSTRYGTLMISSFSDESYLISDRVLYQPTGIGDTYNLDNFFFLRLADQSKQPANQEHFVYELIQYSKGNTKVVLSNLIDTSF